MNGCQYSQATFTLPAGPANVSQEEWDRIFNSEEKGASTKNTARGIAPTRKDANKADL